jgi:hypothetical protein
MSRFGNGELLSANFHFHCPIYYRIFSCEILVQGITVE